MPPVQVVSYVPLRGADLVRVLARSTCDPPDGGEQERALAKQYRSQAATLADSWSQTPTAPRALASMYDTDA